MGNATCKTCGGEAPNHVSSPLDPNGIGNPAHAMTNSKKDSELESADGLEIFLDDIVTAICLRNGDAYDKACIIKKASDKYYATHYITKEESDRRVLEASSKLLDALENHKKTLDYIVKDGAPRNPTNYEVYLRKAIEVDGRIAKLGELLNGDKDGTI